MTELFTIDPTVRTGGGQAVFVVGEASVGQIVSNLDTPATVPAFIGADEAYYWSFEWQRDVRESMEALTQGDYEDFDSDDPDEVSRWLFTVDEDES